MKSKTITVNDNPRGWFQWYYRYYMGWRIVDEDPRQIKRWKMMRRHIAQIQNNCFPGDADCRRRQRKALLHWLMTAEGFNACSRSYNRQPQRV